MGTVDQPTIFTTMDGKPAPAAKPRAKPPPLGHKVKGQTRVYSRNKQESILRATAKRAARREQERKRRTTLNAKDTAIANGTYRFTEADDTPSNKMRKLLEWHTTSPSSHYNWEQDQVAQWEEDQAKEPKDDHRILSSPPEHRETYEKRRPHYDE